MAISLTQLITAETTATIKATLLSVADTLGLETSSWKPLDPTRTVMAMVAEAMASRESVTISAISGGFLDYSTGNWLTFLAKQVYDVDRIEAGYASGDVTITNNSGATIVYAAGEFIVENSSTNKTYRNTEAINIANGASSAIDFLADEAGSDSTSPATDIDTVVTTVLGVTVSNAAALIGTDAETDADLRQRCRDRLGAISPNGAAAAYSYVAKTTTRTDGATVDVTRVKVSANSATGAVTVTLAGASGAPTASDVTDVTTAIEDTVEPLGVTVTVAGATEVTVPITYTAYVPNDESSSDAEIETAVETALTSYFSTMPIGGYQKVSGSGNGKVWADLLEGVIIRSDNGIFTVDLSAPASDTALADTEVAVLGTVTPTITRIVQA